MGVIQFLQGFTKMRMVLEYYNVSPTYTRMHAHECTHAHMDRTSDC